MTANRPRLPFSRALLPILLGVAAYGCDVTAQPNNAQCQTEIAKFLRDPTESSAAAISADDRCGVHLAASAADLQQLDRLVADGNGIAARLLARHLGSLDGGELGDAHRALGKFSALRPDEFLRLAASEELSSRQVSRSVAMLPLELVDDFPAQLSEMMARRSKIERVIDPQVVEMKGAALAALDSIIAQLKRSVAAEEAQDPQGAR